MSNISIKVEHLSKMYRLGVINNGRLWRDIQSWIALKKGKEDPHSKIGQDKYIGDDDHFWALKDLNFTINEGDRVGIIGKNGAGKSTLLKLLSRVTAPTEGIIKIRGKISSLLEVGTGFNGELTGRENIYLNGAILGMKTRQIDRKLDEIIDFSGIEHHIDTPVKRYSSGMYVRLAFAVAAHLDSEILIADEVLAVGDSEFQKKAIGKMNSLSTGQGRTVLFVSHNISAVRSLCNTGILLEKGKVVSQETIEKVLDKYTSDKVTDKFEINTNSLDQKYQTDSICVYNMKIEANSIESGKIKINTPIDVSTEYSLLKNNSKCQISIHLIDSNDNIVFASFNEKSATSNSNCEFFSIPIPEGKYKTYCTIPEFFLNEGIYSINIFYIIDSVIELQFQKALIFEVFDTGEMRKEYVGPWAGIVRPKLFWNTNKIEG